MRESNPSESDAPAPDAPARRFVDASDLSVGAGVIALTLGAGSFHPGAGGIVLGLCLILIGTRGSFGG